MKIIKTVVKKKIGSINNYKNEKYVQWTILPKILSTLVFIF